MQHVETAKAMIEATKAKDVALLMEYFTGDAVFAHPFHPRGPKVAYTGKDQIQASFQGIFTLMDKMDYTNARYTASSDGNTVFFEALGDMTLAGSGKDYDNGYIFRVDFNADGKFKKLTEY